MNKREKTLHKNETFLLVNVRKNTATFIQWKDNAIILNE